jgi:hypothetical protein
LKGGLSYFSAAASNQAKELERMGRDNHLDPAAELFASFEKELTDLLQAVHTFLYGKGAHV